MFEEFGSKAFCPYLVGWLKDPTIPGSIKKQMIHFEVLYTHSDIPASTFYLPS